MKDKILACTKCGVAFPEWDEEMLKDFGKCPYCEGKLEWHKVVHPT